MKCPNCGHPIPERLTVKEAARKMGQARSPAKTRAARRNARKNRRHFQKQEES